MSNLKIVTWKWKGNTTKNKPEYTAEHVNVHYSMVKRNVQIPFDYICVTDDAEGLNSDIQVVPIWDDLKYMGGCYLRLKAFSNEMVDVFGPKFISMDLDCVIVDDITNLVNIDVGFAIWENTNKRKTPYCGGMFMCKPGVYQHVWDDFDPKESPLKAKRKGFTVGTDQAWLSYLFYPDAPHTWTHENGIYNFKIDIEKRVRLDQPPLVINKKLPDNAKIIFFNGGQVDPSYKKLQENYPWIKEHWR